MAVTLLRVLVLGVIAAAADGLLFICVDCDGCCSVHVFSAGSKPLFTARLAHALGLFASPTAGQTPAKLTAY